VEDVNSAGQADIVNHVYRKLGGVLPSPLLNLRAGWDIEFDRMAVELDEYLHFNRFRALTLESPIYIKLAKFPLTLYRKFCLTYEGRCLQAGGYGGKWSNKSAILNSVFHLRPRTYREADRRDGSSEPSMIL
jgi:hypothetical protein